VIAQINTRRAAVARWRNEQSDEKLLDADVRVLFGDQYQKIGWLWKRRLRDRLPQATLRRSRPCSSKNGFGRWSPRARTAAALIKI
jgi:hypothetical protein